MTWLIQAESASNRELRGRRAPSPDPSGATLKNVKTRPRSRTLELFHWNLFGAWNLELGTSAPNRTSPGPMCTRLHLSAVMSALARQNDTLPKPCPHAPPQPTPHHTRSAPPRKHPHPPRHADS